MNHSKKRKIDLNRTWDNLQLYGTYALLAVGALLGVISYIPNFPNFLGYRELTIFFCIGFIIIFKNINQYLIHSKKSKITRSVQLYEGLDRAINICLKKKGKITTLDILAQSTHSYYSAIKHRIENDDSHKSMRKPIDRLRILVTNPEILRAHSVPPFDMNKWKSISLKNGEKLFKDIEIVYCGFLPTKHFAIVDGKYYIFGLYNMFNLKEQRDEKEFPVFDIIYNDSFGDILRDDFQMLFNPFFKANKKNKKFSTEM